MVLITFARYLTSRVSGGWRTRSSTRSESLSWASARLSLLFTLLPLLTLTLTIKECRNFVGLMMVRNNGDMLKFDPAHMFWWLYRSPHRVEDPSNPWPTILWLEGGPGGSGVGFGNFLEIGPLDVDLKPRNSTWFTKADLLFVDSPVGTGFSYVEDESLAVKTDEALQLGGVALGDSWISPEDFVFSWGPLLKDLSRLDSNALYSSNSLAQKIQQELAEEKYEDATNTWGVLRDVISAGSNDVDFYNFMLDSSNDPVESRTYESKGLMVDRYSKYMRTKIFSSINGASGPDLYTVMNGPIKQKLKIIPENVTWDKQGEIIFPAMVGDFMKPRIKEVDELLAKGVPVHDGSSFLVPGIFCFNNMGCGARSHAHDLNLEKGNVIGNFNGEFWGMFAVRWKPHVSFVCLTNTLSVYTLSFGNNMQQDEEYNLQRMEYENWNEIQMREGGTTNGSGITLLYIVFVCSMTLGTILMCFLQKKNAKGEEALPDSSVSFYSSMVSLSKSVIAPLFDLRMLLIIPLIAYSGLQQAFVWAEYTKYIAEPTLGESGVGGAMAMYEAFDAIIIVTSGVLSILYPLLMAAALEIGDGIFNTQLSALLGMLFKHDMRKERTTQGLAVCFDRSCVFCEPLRFFACCVSGYACCSLHLCCRVSIPHSYGRESILLC
ncbi:unnamed protein product [Camellia sinensis]